MCASGPACRRHPLATSEPNDAGVTPSIDADIDIGVDAGGGTDTGDAVAPADAVDPSDASDASDRPAPPQVPCAVLRVLSSLGPFTTYHARQVLFSRDRRFLVLRAFAEYLPSGAPALDDLLLVPLPLGHPETLVNGVMDVEWLGNSERLLATIALSGDLVVVSLDGTPPRTIARRTCAHVASSDGTRLLVLRDCDNNVFGGALDDIDVASGAVTPRAPSVPNEGGLALSPSGRFAAYVAGDINDPRSTVLHVLDGDRDVALAQVPAHRPVFVSDQRLLFVAAPSWGQTDAYVHVPGSGDGSQQIAQHRHFGFDRYRISPDGSLLLAALWSNMQPWDETLFAVRLDGGGEQLLTGRLYPYHLNQLGFTPFAFSADGARAIYAGSPSSAAGIFASAPGGGTSYQLSNGFAFAASPYADRVVTIEIGGDDEHHSLHVVAGTTGDEAFAYGANDLLRPVTFVPDDRGLLYVEWPNTGIGISRLRHLSFVDGHVSLLGQWQRTNLPVGVYPIGEMQPVYPVDPTGCFTLVDSDLPEALGTSLVVLPDAPE
jgi:hypothetical protein